MAIYTRSTGAVTVCLVGYLMLINFHFRSVTGSKRTAGHVQPSHPFIQDPTMPPNPAPSPLIQLEEVRRRLEEEKIKSGTLQPKQRQAEAHTSDYCRHPNRGCFS